MPSIEKNSAATICILNKQELGSLRYSITEVLATVEGAYQAYAAGHSANPKKITAKPQDDHSVAYAMLGRDGERYTVGFKTSYKFNPNRAQAPEAEQTDQKYYTSLLLYDDTNGMPVALMDCSLVGALRTPAASALIARECAHADARTVLVVGCGTQGQNALPFLITAMPQLERLIIHGNHPTAIAAAIERMRLCHPERRIEISTNLEASARAADIIIGTAGPASEKTSGAVRHAWLRPGTLCILVGYGLHPELLHRADYRVATSAAQMRVTGTDLTDENGNLPEIDAELPDILTGKKIGRDHPDQRIFAYNSGMIITDIALGRLFAERAQAQGLGQTIQLW